MTRTASAALACVMLAAAVAVASVPGTPQSGRPFGVTIRARAIAPGEVVLVTVTTATPATAVRISGFNRDFPVFRDTQTTWRSLVGLDLDVKPGVNAISVEAAPLPERATHRLTVVPKKFKIRTLSVDPAFVNPPADVQVRIQEDAARLNHVWASSSDVRLWSGSFIRPVAAPANSAFGSRSVFNGELRNPHGGADFSSEAGTPVRAPNAGRIAVAANLYFTGNTVVIDHGLGLFSLFAHLQTIDMREGDTVVTGQFVGNVGATGRVTGPHLHWSVRLNDARVDPLSLLWVLGQSR